MKKKHKRRAAKPEPRDEMMLHEGVEDSLVTVEGCASDLVRDVYNRTIPWVHNLHLGKSAFLIGRGWSATRERLETIKNAGIFTMAVNSYQSWFRPDAFLASDPPHYHSRAIWTDPEVMKFAPIHNAGLPIPLGDWEPMAKKLKELPGVYFFNQRCNTTDDWFLSTPFCSFGSAAYGPNDNLHPQGGLRSSMFPALRVLYHLGFRNVGLLGCDGDVNTAHTDPNYHLELDRMLEKLKPAFDYHGYKVMQSNPNAHLRAYNPTSFEKVMGWLCGSN